MVTGSTWVVEGKRIYPPPTATPRESRCVHHLIELRIVESSLAEFNGQARTAPWPWHLLVNVNVIFRL
jgi:hypothetical protein